MSGAPLCFRASVFVSSLHRCAICHMPPSAGAPPESLAFGISHPAGLPSRRGSAYRAEASQWRPWPKPLLGTRLR